MLFKMPSHWRNCSHIFCYVCGSFTSKAHPIWNQKVYQFYFGFSFGDQDKSWVPHMFSWSQCTKGLSYLKEECNAVCSIYYLGRTKESFKNSYFRMVKVCGFRVKTEHKIVYPNIESIRRQLLRDHDDLPVPVPLENGLLISDEDVFCEKKTSDMKTSKEDAVFVND